MALGASVSLQEEISLLRSRGAHGGILKISPGRAARTGFGGWGSGVRPEKESGLVATKRVKLPFRPGEKWEEGAASGSTAAAGKGRAEGKQVDTSGCLAAKGEKYVGKGRGVSCGSLFLFLVGFFLIYFKLKDNCFPILCWFRPYIKMNQP